MKNTNVVSAVVGASFFAIPFLLIPTAPLWASIAIGATAFGASELMFSDSRKIAKLKEKNKKKKKKRIIKKFLMMIILLYYADSIIIIH